MSDEGMCSSGVRVVGTTVFIECELDEASGPQVTEFIDGLDIDGLTVDLSGVDFIDSAGLRCLLLIKGAADSRQRTLTFCNAHESVQHLLFLTGTARLLGLFPHAPDDN